MVNFGVKGERIKNCDVPGTMRGNHKEIDDIQNSFINHSVELGCFHKLYLERTGS